MRILGIETSCDETALAVFDSNLPASQAMIAELISSQTIMHSEYGGVVPELASREHLRNLPLLLNQVVKDAQLTEREIDVIAVTAGPGLKGCLLMGVSFAQGLGIALNKPVVPINHVEAHQFSAFIGQDLEIPLPFISVIVSGGHTEIVKVNAVGQYELLARTADDAVGEAFDKSANLLGLSYPGGAVLAKLADEFNKRLATSGELKKFKSAYVLPKVMREAQGLSFSGLKTAISLCVSRAKQSANFENEKAELAWVIQRSIVDALVFKLKQQIEMTGIKQVVLSGGVSANRLLQSEIRSIPQVTLWVPKAQHCTDNAAMIAYLASLKIQAGIQTEDDLTVRPRWWLESLKGK
jgi:N6-L-threonylcarbamoyladenine synthase